MDSIAENYKAATDKFLNLIDSIDSNLLDKSDSEGWTPRQVIHHMADSEAQAYVRLRRLIAEPGTTIQGYDEGKWAENPTLNYRNHDISSSLTVIKAVRQSSYELIKRLTETDMNKSGTHSESGSYDVRTWIEIYSNHPKEHAEQIMRLME